MNIIKVRKLSFTYPNGKKVLSNISFNVKKGECLTILGPNGSGKTTLIYHLNGIIPNLIAGKSEGKVIVNGKNVFETPIYELAKDVGIVFQDPDAQILMLDVKTECAFGPANLGMPKDVIFKRIKWALEVTGLRNLENKQSKNLSSGQKQRLAIASALAMGSKILLLDEPTSQLDPRGTCEIYSVLKTLKENVNLTLVIVTHEINDEIIELTDKFLILSKNGKVLAFGESPDILRDIKLLEEAHLNLPPVTELYLKLNLPEEEIKLPITLDEACSIFSELINRGKIKIKYNNVKATNTVSYKTNPLLEIKNLTYIYPDGTTALKDINLRIYENEFIAIIGNNGSGKTTLIKHFVGLLKPTIGHVLFKGRDIKNFTTGELAKKIGIVLQNPNHQLFTLSVEEEIRMSLQTREISQAKIEEKIHNILKLIGLEDKKDESPRRLSFGERKKLALGAILAMEPEIIVLDEPTSGLDSAGKLQILELIWKLYEKGHTIILVTHDIDLVAKYAKRVIIMNEGRIIMDASPQEAFSKTNLLRIAGVRAPQIKQLADLLKMPEYVVNINDFLNVISVRE